MLNCQRVNPDFNHRWYDSHSQSWLVKMALFYPHPKSSAVAVRRRGSETKAAYGRDVFVDAALLPDIEVKSKASKHRDRSRKRTVFVEPGEVGKWWKWETQTWNRRKKVGKRWRNSIIYENMMTESEWDIEYEYDCLSGICLEDVFSKHDGILASVNLSVLWGPWLFRCSNLSILFEGMGVLIHKNSFAWDQLKNACELDEVQGEAPFWDS